MLRALFAAFVILAGWGNVLRAADPPAEKFLSKTIDIGVVCSDVQASIKFYTQVIGFKEAEPFSVPAKFAQETGLSDHQPFKVHVMVLGDGEGATKLKLMQFFDAPGKKTDQTYIHSSVGFSYLTIMVADLNAAVAQAAAHGSKPIAQGPKSLPEGFPSHLGLAILRDPDGNLVELVGPYKP